MNFGDTRGFGFIIGYSVFNVVTFVYDVLTLPIYFIFQNPIGRLQKAKQKKAAVVAEDETSITFSSIQKPKKFHKELVEEHIDTLAKVFPYCSKKFGTKKCLGTRQILNEVDEVQPNGKVFKKYKLGGYKWRTYKQVDEEVTQLSHGLRELGIHPGDSVVIFAETRAEWMVAAHALFKQNVVLVTIYATLGDEAIIHAINETEVNTVITSSELLSKFKNILGKTQKVKTIIYMEDQLKGLIDVEEIEECTKLYTYSEVLERGVHSKSVTLSPTPDDTAIIMYTSSSTGVPKGVILSHRNLIATLIGFSDAAEMCKNDVMMGFLPLAHVFELLVENICIFMGVAIGYSTPLTMLDSSSKIMKGSSGDATILKPTFLTSVPLIMDRIAAGIQEKVSKSNFLVRLLFNFGYKYKLRWIRYGFSTPIVNRIIFGQVRKLVGGRVRLIIAGGAPLTPETHELIKTCLCIALWQGYGLTESTSSTSVQDEYDMTTGRVGPPLTGINIRLVSWEEGNYTVRDKPYPRGEIIIGGNNVSEGYFKLSEKTKEDFFVENYIRWFRTGDIGEVHEDGVLKLIDRKKDLVKLQMGEYISLGKIESILKTHSLVENICIHADSTQNYCVALMVAHRENLITLANRNGITNKTFEELCDEAALVKVVLEELANYGKKVNLQKYEIPAAIALVKEIWAPENGLITTTFKLKRKYIEEYYADTLKRLYSLSDS